MHAHKYQSETIATLKAGARELLGDGFDQDAAALMCVAEFGPVWGITDEQIAYTDGTTLAETLLEMAPQVLTFSDLAHCAYTWSDGPYFEAMRGDRHVALYQMRRALQTHAHVDEMAAEATEVGNWTVDAARSSGSAIYSTATVAVWLGVFTPLAGVHVFSACTGLDGIKRYGNHSWTYPSARFPSRAKCVRCEATQV